MDRKSAVFIAMGVECVGVIVVCLYIGRWIDTKLGWGGLGAALGAFIGLIGWVSHLLIVTQQLAKENDSGHTDDE